MNPNALPTFSASSPEGVSLGTVVTLLRRRLPYALLPLVLALAVAGAVALLAPARYRAEALVTSTPIVPLDPSQPPTQLEQVEARIAAIRSILFRRSVLEPMVTELQLAPQKEGRVSDADLEEVRKRISIRVDGEDVIALSFEGTTAAQAEAAASRLATALTTWSNDAQRQRADASVAFLETQLPAARKELEDRIKELERYQQKNERQLPEQAASTMKMMEGAQARLMALGSTIAEDEARVSALRTEIADLEQQGISATGRRAAADPRIAEKRLALRHLEGRYTAEHPDVKRARAELAELERATASGEGGQVDPDESPLRLRHRQLRSELAAAEGRLARSRSEEASLGKQSDDFRSQLETAPKHEIAVAGMKRDIEEAKLHHQALLGRVHEARLAASLASSSDGAAFRILEAPRAPDRPFAPRRSRILLLGLVAGVALGGAAVLVREQLDKSIRGVDEVESTTSRPVLVTIPRARPIPGRGPAMLEEPHGVVAEQYRILAAKLVHTHGTMRPMSILVTSAICGEGKTTTAVNLSLALARLAPGSVLLVDADFGRPAVHKVLGLPPGDGLRRFLKNPDGDPLAYVRQHEGIDILETGGLSNGIRTALASPAAHRLFTKLRKHYPYVVVDAPPVLAVAESLLLQRMVTSTLFVVRAGYTPRETALRGLSSLEGSRVAGVVLNDVGKDSAYAYPYASTAIPAHAVLVEGSTS